MTLRHETRREFGIPKEQHFKQIDGDVLSAIGGFSREATTPGSLALALVLLEGYSFDGQRSWTVTARSAHIGDEQEPVFGSFKLTDDNNDTIAAAQALDAGDSWIRSQPTTEFVPGQVLSLPVPDGMENSGTAGLLLVRAADGIDTLDEDLGLHTPKPRRPWGLSALSTYLGIKPPTTSRTTE